MSNIFYKELDLEKTKLVPVVCNVFEFGTTTVKVSDLVLLSDF